MAQGAPASLFVTVPRAMDDLLATELSALGATAVEPARGGVACTGSLALAYRICLWSRLASRVLLPIGRFSAPSPEELYEGVRSIDWSLHLGPDDTLAVDYAAVASTVHHTHFGALKVKDAIVDQLRDRHGMRPSVDVESPSVRVNVYVERDDATVSIDLSGTSLHRRSYRVAGVAAPLKENVAAALLLRARWPDAAATGAPLVDPMCGSGTLPIEAALIALDAAPGLGRSYFGFLGWRGHDAATWQALVDEARARRRPAESIGPIVGFDTDPAAVRAAIANVAQAGLASVVHIERRDLTDAAPPASERAGLVVTNPPYGERLSDVAALRPLYGTLGRVLKERFGGWSAHMLTASDELAGNVGLRAARRNVLWNGKLECHLWHYAITPAHLRTRSDAAPAPAAGAAEDARAATAISMPATARASSAAPPAARSAGATMLANRLSKNERTLSRWAAQEGITCYRLYDADLPEYAAAIDRYESFLHVQEYAAPASIDAGLAQARFRELLDVCRDVLAVPRDRLFFKVRRRQKKGSQYRRRSEGDGSFHEVHEGGHRFLVNFTDYLDTGLFLDHRLVRRRIGNLAAGRRFLNLFCYTASATVYAAKGGATTTTSIDLSKSYLHWAERNLRQNGIVAGRGHLLIQADCREWLAEEARAHHRYDLILLDPPTFSNSKRMEGTFDIQRDYVDLLTHTAALLAPGGVLIFSNNYRRFRMDPAAFPSLAVTDITAASLPRDFSRNPRIHNCWEITHKHPS